MGTTADVLAEIRADIDADHDALTEARTRLALVRDAGSSFYGALRTYQSGSLAVHTMNGPVSDGDGGLVLDRRCYPRLGPEGDNESPLEVVEDLCTLIGPIIRETYPKARINTSKRGPMVTFAEPVNDQNPTVDLVVALTRKEGNGLWIPNLTKNTWEPSDPEAHVALLNSGTASFRSTRRKVIRLAKAWNKQYATPGVSSFMLSVWAYEFMEPGMGIPAGLHALFEGAANRLESRQATPDPAGVSANLKLLLPADKVRPRLRKAADAVAEAMSNEGDEQKVRAALAKIFWKYIDNPASEGLATAAGALSNRLPVTTAALGLSGVAATIPPTRSFGGNR